ncbi:4179_t:CDS:2 [Funneliformis caledonium]|uniref:4179_t:CDS:1 n=1 Tax=Funneliformis caledonium TaxID=1117310 RepID=A0A9N9FSN7_9GLOM|nr:4179_t:CDS:2 [Funneliformis caledonium]
MKNLILILVIVVVIFNDVVFSAPSKMENTENLERRQTSCIQTDSGGLCKFAQAVCEGTNNVECGNGYCCQQGQNCMLDEPKDSTAQIEIKVATKKLNRPNGENPEKIW